MKKIVLSMILLGCVPTTYSNEQITPQDLLVISKMAGVCGVMQQMAEFQTSTKMNGGSEFIERFWKSEFARLGKTQEQFFSECEKSIELYSRMMIASENQ